MGSDLMLGGFGQSEGNKNVMVRATKNQRAVQRREQEEGANLLFEARKQEFTAALRQRMAEKALHDVQGVGELARELAGDDPFLAGMLAPIAVEFARQASQDIRTFGNGLGF